MTKKARINQQMGQNNQKDQKGPKLRAAVMLVQNNQNNQKIWSPHNYYLVDVLHICDHTDPSQQDLTPHHGRDQLYTSP